MNEREYASLLGSIGLFLEQARHEWKNPHAVEPEVLRAKAREFATRESKLVDRLMLKPVTSRPVTDPSPGGYTLIAEPSGQRELYVRVYLLDEQIPIVPPFQIRRVRFEHHSVNLVSVPYPFVHLPQILEVDTTNSLCIGLHMDECTRRQVNNLLDKDQIMPSLLETIYFFDKDGGNGKVSALPKVVLDNRRNLGETESPQKLVESEMTQDDLLIIYEVLSALERRIL